MNEYDRTITAYSEAADDLAPRYDRLTRQVGSKPRRGIVGSSYLTRPRFDQRRGNLCRFGID